MSGSAGSMDRRPRILVAEDEFLVAAMLQQMLEDLGYACVGPCSNLADAMAVATTEPLDGAIIDLSIVEEDAASLTQILIDRKIPVGLSTGLPADADDQPLRRNLPRMMKPFTTEDLRALLAELGLYSTAAA